MKPLIKIFVAIAVTGSLASCQKVINVDLNNSDSRYIISGEVTDAPGPYYVTVSRSKNFDDNNDFPGVSGAITIIKDITSGLVDTLAEESVGRYKTNTIVGVTGHSYELEVLVDGQTFSASSAMPARAVEIDSLYAKLSDFGNDDHYIVPVFNDPAGLGNNYLLRQYVNGQVIKGSVARNDDATDGRKIEFALYYDTDEDTGNPIVKNGDNIKVELLCTDKNVYDFYRTLQETTDQDSGTPANPLSNIKGGAIGVFSAATIRSKTAIAEF